MSTNHTKRKWSACDIHIDTKRDELCNIYYLQLIKIKIYTTHSLAMSGFKVLSTGRPLPIGAFTKSRKSFSGWQRYRLAALAVSITEPPPMARKESNWPCLAKSMAALKLKKKNQLARHLVLIFNLFFHMHVVLFHCMSYKQNSKAR